MKRTKICQLITELGPAGAERCVYELARRLDPRRFDVQVVALRGGQVSGWLNEAGVRTSILDVRGKWDCLKLVKLERILRDERIDLLHTHLFHADLAGRLAAEMAGVRHVVHTVHVAEGRFRPWQFAWARLTAGSCDKIVCVSRSVLDYHCRRSGLPRWRYRIIPNGIDVGAYAKSGPARQRLRAEWGLSDGEVLTAFVGRLDHQKGLNTFLGAMSHLGARGVPRKVVVAGDGPERGLVENFIAHGEGGGNCRFLGFRRDVRDILSAADIFVMPSRWEGFGLVAAEAMAASLPVVATRVAGIRDVVADGETSIMVDPNDCVAVAEAVQMLAGDADLRARLGAAGRARVAEHFNIAANIAAHERLYEEIIAAAPTL